MTRKKAEGEHIPLSGVDRILLPQQYAARLHEALGMCLQGAVWVRFWAGDTPADTEQMMRRCRAFAKSFTEYPKEYPEITAKLRGQRIAFRRGLDGLSLEMDVRRRSSWAWEEK